MWPKYLAYPGIGIRRGQSGVETEMLSGRRRKPQSWILREAQMGKYRGIDEDNQISKKDVVLSLVGGKEVKG